MQKLRVLSLFSGIGSFEKALGNVGVDFELKGFSEIDDAAIKSYCKIHNVSEDMNLGDITKIDMLSLPEFDVLTHGSPCQDFSSIGKQQGGDKDSETRSSLMWNTVEIIRTRKPKYVIWENVKNVVAKQHIHNFNKYLESLSDMGYSNFYKVLNAKNYNIPQNRERIFVVSILGDEVFEFPEAQPLTVELKSFLLDGYKYEDEIKEEDKVDKRIKRGCRIAFAEHYENIINCEKDRDIYDCRATTDFQDKKVGVRVSPCLKAFNSNIHVLNGKRIQRLQPEESWALMGFDKEDFKKAESTGCSKTQLYKQAGNSIVVNVLEAIFEQLLQAYIVKEEKFVS